MSAITLGKLLKKVVTLLVLTSLFACTTDEKKKVDIAEHESKLVLSFGASGAAFSPDGKLLALANREKVWVIETGTRRVTNTIRSTRFGKFGNTKGLIFIDNQRLVIGKEGGIVLFDLADDLNTHQFTFPSRYLSPRAIAWSPVTKTLAFSTGALSLPVNLVKISGRGFGSTIGFPGFNGVPADLEFSGDGRFLAAAGDGDGVLIREVASGEVAGELPTSGYVNELARFGDNRLLVAGADLALWSFYTDDEISALDDPSLQGQISSQVAVRIAGATALGALTAILLPFAAFAGSGDGLYALGEATYRTASSPVYTTQGHWCGRSTAISSDGSLLADIYPGITREVIRVIALESGEVLKDINPPGDYSCNVKFSPDGKHLLITTSKLARIYDTENWNYYDLKLN